LLHPTRATLIGLATLLILSWCAGMFARGYWTPDEPREADIAWRMSWQSDKAVPLLAGEAFCEKPPLAYWVAALPMRWWGADGWAARVPNLLYAMITALSIGGLARRAIGPAAGLVAAAAVSTLLLSYQVAIWLATDAPLLAATAVALLGLHQGFYAAGSRQRWRGYTLMHAALGLGFLCKSAAGWMVPALTLATLIVWEKRWRELLRWELYLGLLLQAAMILTWIGFVYVGEDGPAHLKVFFWNNLVGRFTHVDAPSQLQYAAGHRNFPGKYFIELPLYLFPWTFAALAAIRRAWRQRRGSLEEGRALRFALAASLPSLLVLSLAATARNIYFAPALPGVGLLLAWWLCESAANPQPWDVRALRATAILLLVSAVMLAFAAVIVGVDSWAVLSSRALYLAMSAAGLIAAAYFALKAWPAAMAPAAAAPWLFLAYAALLIGPLPPIYGQVDAWQDLPGIARAVRRDAAGKPLALLHPDETIRAMIDMYTTTSVTVIDGAPQADLDRIHDFALTQPGGLLLRQLPGRSGPRSAFLARYLHATASAPPPAVPGRALAEYRLPNGRRYELLEPTP
jgi:4-amino-4-deoxy-L-arabinose transferase-like glycosyltransferase